MTVDPAADGACKVTLPLVSPAIITPLIILLPVQFYMDTALEQQLQHHPNLVVFYILFAIERR
jgi:hypothetical protein